MNPRSCHIRQSCQSYPGLSGPGLGIELADCWRSEKAERNAWCRKILRDPQLEACNTRAPQRGDSAVSTFAGRMGQSCVVALGKRHGSWVQEWRWIPYAAGGNWSGGGEEDLRLWCIVHSTSTHRAGIEHGNYLPVKIPSQRMHHSGSA